MKKFKKLCSAIVAVMMVLSISAVANAAEIDSSNVSATETESVIADDGDDGYVLVSKDEYIDEDGWLIETKIFVKDEPGVQSADRGDLSVRLEKNFTISGFKWVTMTVGGDFSWDKDADTATVKNPWGSFSIEHGSAEYVSGGVKSGSNQGATVLFGKKYAYVEQRLRVDSGLWKGDKEFVFWVDVNVVGDLNEKTDIIQH